MPALLLLLFSALEIQSHWNSISIRICTLTAFCLLVHSSQMRLAQPVISHLAIRTCALVSLYNVYCRRRYQLCQLRQKCGRDAFSYERRGSRLESSATKPVHIRAIYLTTSPSHCLTISVVACPARLNALTSSCIDLKSSLFDTVKLSHMATPRLTWNVARQALSVETTSRRSQPMKL